MTLRGARLQRVASRLMRVARPKTWCYRVVEADGECGPWQLQGQMLEGEPPDGVGRIEVHYVEGQEAADSLSTEGAEDTPGHAPEVPRPNPVGDESASEVIRNMPTGISNGTSGVADDFPEGVTEWLPDPAPLVYHDTLAEDDPSAWPQRCPRWWFGSWPPRPEREAEARALLSQDNGQADA